MNGAADRGIVFESVCKVYAEVTALAAFTASVAPGEFISLLGPSGCGKTTLLRIAAGLTPPSSGRVTIQGREVAGPRRDACLVFQNFGLLPWRPVLANVEFPLELDGVKPGPRREQAMHYIRLVGLEKYAGHYPHELSGGMQQRVGIARSLVRRPAVLFMDEPFGALDAQTREQLQEDFLKIWAEIGTTVLFVTHSIDEALVMSDRIFVFSAAPGSLKAVVASPVAHLRMDADPRLGAAYVETRAALRGMLRQEGT